MTDQQLIHTGILLLAAVPFGYAAISDIRRYTIPNACTLALCCLYPFHFWLAPQDVPLTASLIVMSTAFAVSFAFHALKRLGGGDVKLITVAALWAGPALVGDFVIVMALAGGLLSLVYISHFYIAPVLGFDHAGPSGIQDNPLTTKLPYGVAIAAGGLVTLLQLAH